MEFYIKPKTSKFTICIETDYECTISFKKYSRTGRRFLVRLELNKFEVEWFDDQNIFTLDEPGTFLITPTDIRRKSLLNKSTKDEKLCLKWSYMRDYLEKLQYFPSECIIPYGCIDVYYYYRLALKDSLSVHPNVDRFQPTPLAQVDKLIFTAEFVELWDAAKRMIASKDRKSNAKMIAEFVGLIAKVYPILYAIPLKEGLSVSERLAANGTKFAYCSRDLCYGFKPFHTDELDLNKNNLP
eukprot:NODE_267_length_12253_cov_0.255718.p4 type:complete len:241 gc:universal NODE_267_length_12253_cov_0.255718:11105-11827(+)